MYSIYCNTRAQHTGASRNSRSCTITMTATKQKIFVIGYRNVLFFRFFVLFHKKDREKNIHFHFNLWSFQLFFSLFFPFSLACYSSLPWSIWNVRVLLFKTKTMLCINILVIQKQVQIVCFFPLWSMQSSAICTYTNAFTLLQAKYSNSKQKIRDHSHDYQDNCPGWMR